MYNRSRYAAGLISYRKCSAVDINLHSRQSIDQRQCIRTTGFCCLCDLCNIRNIWCQFHDDRLFCDLFDLSRQFFYMLCVLSKCKKSRIDIRARDIDLHHINRFIRQPLNNRKILFRRMSADIHNDLCIIFLQKRNISFTEQVNSRILKSDRIHHPAVYLCYTWCRIPRPRDICDSLGRHRSETVQINKLTEFFSRTKCTGSHCNRILPLYAGNIYFHIHYKSTSVDKNTGPSLQILLLFTLLCASFSFVLQTHARQAPIPHAILSSREI